MAGIYDCIGKPITYVQTDRNGNELERKELGICTRITILPSQLEGQIKLTNEEVANGIPMEFSIRK